MSNSPLVTVICLCYNHERFVEDAMQSVLDQSYPNVQLIVVDDASSDNSVEVINGFCSKHPDIHFLINETNLGNCKSFNNALQFAKGEYLIDLAADDVLNPNRVQQGVAAFDIHDDDYGVNFCNAEYIDTKGKHLHYFYALESKATDIQQGEMFATLIERYAICSPTTMFKREVIEQMGGYDESLSYEDFDFWVRSSRYWKYCYTHEVLVKKRVVKGSHGSQQYRYKSRQMDSTFRVCQKACQLCKSKREYKALRKRIRYELKHSLWNLKFSLAVRYLFLWIKAIG